jgi:tRNA(His) guanylyltransferase
MKDPLGDRMKEFYENRTRILLPRRTFTMIRIDGKAFHTYTQGLQEPFDTGLIEDMDETTKFLCKAIQGAKLGYVQSDEISIVMTDFDNLQTNAWFNGNIQKIVSIAASYATSKFNQLRMLREAKKRNYYAHGGNYSLSTRDLEKFILANFDARTYTIPHLEEVVNYFIWRQNDATRNSISAVAQSLYSHSELENKTTNQMQELIFQKGQNWNDFPIGQKRGRVILKDIVKTERKKEDYEKARDKSNWIVEPILPQIYVEDKLYEPANRYFVKRSGWIAVDPPIFTKDKEFLKTRIMPVQE